MTEYVISHADVDSKIIFKKIIMIHLSNDHRSRGIISYPKLIHKQS